MGRNAVNEEQKAIIQYIKDHFVDWMAEKHILPYPQKEDSLNTQLLERMVRVEETLKRQNEKFDHQNEKFDHQNEKFDLLLGKMDQHMMEIDRRFAEVDRRFEDMNQRFIEIDRRFDRQSLYHLATFSAIVGSAVAIILKG